MKNLMMLLSNYNLNFKIYFSELEPKLKYFKINDSFYNNLNINNYISNNENEIDMDEEYEIDNNTYETQNKNIKVNLNLNLLKQNPIVPESMIHLIQPDPYKTRSMALIPYISPVINTNLINNDKNNKKKLSRINSINNISTIPTFSNSNNLNSSFSNNYILNNKHDKSNTQDSNKNITCIYDYEDVEM